MIPVQCMVIHNPPNTYGDCVRACIASILEMGSPDVPHFYHDGCDGEEGTLRIINWLKPQGLAWCLTAWSGDVPLDEMLTHAGYNTNGAHYILFGGTDGGVDHVVVCQHDKQVFNPTWGGISITGPNSANQWTYAVIARL